MIDFYDSELGQAIYSWRSISVELLIEHIKDVFKIDPLPVSGCRKGAATSTDLSDHGLLQLYNWQQKTKIDKIDARELAKQKIDLRIET